jgi:hypothetical protein
MAPLREAKGQVVPHIQGGALRHVSERFRCYLQIVHGSNCKYQTVSNKV